MDLDGNYWKQFEVAKGQSLSPAEWKIFETGLTLGSFMTFRQQQAFLDLVNRGLIVMKKRRGGTDVEYKKPAKRPKPRPDTITKTNQKVGVPYSITVKYGNGTESVNRSTTTTMTEYKFDQKSGSYDPKWVVKSFPKLVPFDWLVPTPYIRCIKQKKILSSGVVATSANVSRFDVPQGTMNAVITGAFWNSTVVPTSVRNAAKLKFHKKLADSKVDVMTFVGESKSSFSMISNAASDLLQIYKSVRSGNLRKANSILRSRGRKKPRHVSKRVDQRWLEYQYGWAPLLGDIHTAFQEITNGRETPAVFFTKSKIAFEPTPYNDSISTESSFGEYRVQAWYALKANDKARELAQWNLGSNPLLTAWELVPLSFVADWFIPIGDFLQQYSSDNGLHFVSGTEAWDVRYTAQLESIQRFSAGTGWVDVKRIISEETFFHQRKVLSSTPFASYPPFDPGASFRRFLNGLALITVRTGKPK